MASKVQPEVEAGSHFTAVLREDGAVWCCGLSADGELGVGETSYFSKTAVQVKGLSDVISIESTRGYIIKKRWNGMGLGR